MKAKEKVEKNAEKERKRLEQEAANARKTSHPCAAALEGALLFNATPMIPAMSASPFAVFGPVVPYGTSASFAAPSTPGPLASSLVGLEPMMSASPFAAFNFGPGVPYGTSTLFATPLTPATWAQPSVGFEPGAQCPVHQFSILHSSTR